MARCANGSGGAGGCMQVYIPTAVSDTPLATREERHRLLPPALAQRCRPYLLSTITRAINHHERHRVHPLPNIHGRSLHCCASLAMSLHPILGRHCPFCSQFQPCCPQSEAFKPGAPQGAADAAPRSHSRTALRTTPQKLPLAGHDSKFSVSLPAFLEDACVGVAYG